MWYAWAMNENEKNEKVSYTIDSNGNVVPKPYGPSRWANEKKYDCQHEEDCENAAILLVQGPWPHNCCAQHGKEWGLE